MEVVPDLMDTTRDQHRPKHFCCLFETDEEHRQILRKYLRMEVERNERVIYVSEGETEPGPAWLRKVLPTGRENGRDDACPLVVVPEQVLLKDGAFAPDRMLAFLRSESEDAVRRGYIGLRVICEMGWVLKGLPGCEKLFQYESVLTTCLADMDCSVMCLYDRRRFGPMLLLYAMATHPRTMVGTEPSRNPYYLTPPEFLGSPCISAETLSHWLHDLIGESADVGETTVGAA